jgi:hypothetical protein
MIILILLEITQFVIGHFFYLEMMSALFRSEFYTRMKRYWGENSLIFLWKDFFIHLKPRVESFWGVLSCCLTPSILFNFQYKKNKNLWLIYLHILTGWKTSGACVLTLQCNSYLSHFRSFLKISSNFLSLISSYPLLKMFFSTLSFLWTTAVGPLQNM